MAKQKLVDLPQEEQDKIIAEMKELKIGGVYAAYTVEGALEKIAKAKAKLNGESNENENEQDNADDKEPAENKEPKEQPKQAKKEAKKEEKTLICHICRSKVVNGVCTGCGFTLKRG